MSAQNEKGFELGLTLIVGTAIILLTATVIFAGIKYAQSKLDEELAVKLCRLSNEIKFGIRDKTKLGAFVSGEPICNTIDKHSKEKNFVPTSKYRQNKEGAELEIRKMIKECWSMWLEGSKTNMFKAYPFNEPCFTCYTFKIEDKVKGVTSDSIFKLMEEPFYAEDASDKCAPDIGGYWRQECEQGEEPRAKKIENGIVYKCCTKDLKNVCENKGGQCSSQGKPSEDYSIYDKWQCPKRDQICYVKRDTQYSYIRYIREYSEIGGEIFFKPPNEQSNEISYIPGKIYAINFVSPSEQICYKDPKEGTGCIIKIGTYGLAVAGGAVILAKVSFVSTAVGTALTYAGKFALYTVGGNILATLGAYQFGLLDSLAKGAVDLAISPIATDAPVPNFIIISTFEDAQEMGCIMDYGI